MRYAKSSWLIIMLASSLIMSACNFGQEPEPTPDVGAIFTAAAETVQAQFSLELTQTALAAPTATPLPSPTPTSISFPTFALGGSPAAPATTPQATLGIGTQPAVISTLATATRIGALATQGETCYNSAYVSDVTYPDGATVKGGERIAKIWSVQNTGTCTWDDGFSLQPVTGERMDGKPWEITTSSSKQDFVQPDEIVEIRVEMTVPTSAGEHGGCWRMRGDNDYYFGTFLCVLVKVE